VVGAWPNDFLRLRFLKAQISKLVSNKKKGSETHREPGRNLVAD
jgi:hypothetical protein